MPGNIPEGFEVVPAIPEGFEIVKSGNRGGGSGGGSDADLGVEPIGKDEYPLTDPNTWRKAAEGFGIATGITAPIPEENKVYGPTGSRTVTIAQNLGEGLANLYRGALAGTDQFGSDVLSLLGFDSAADTLEDLAEKRRGSRSKNSAAGAIGEELGYGAGMGAAGGKAVDILLGGAKGIGRLARSGVFKRGKQRIDEVLEEARGKYPTEPPSFSVGPDGRFTEASMREGREYAGRLNMADMAEQTALSKPTMFPVTKFITDLVGKVSPATQDFLEKYWDTIAAYLFGGKNASMRLYNRLAKEAMEYGVPKGEIQRVLDLKYADPKALEPLRDAVVSPTTTGLAKLIGTAAAAGKVEDVNEKR